MDWQKLGERAVAAGFEWRVRMVDVRGCIVLDVDDRGIPTRWFDPRADGMPTFGSVSGYGSPAWCEDVWRDVAPDLSDPATLGAYDETLRERAGDPSLHLATIDHDPPQWFMASGNMHIAGDLPGTPRDTRAEALVDLAEWLKGQGR